MTTTTDVKDIHATVMLAELSVSQWTARKLDRRATQQVADSNKVESRNGAYYKSLIEGGSLEEIRKLVTKARNAHWRRTLPWSDAGPRVLSNMAYLDYMQDMAEYGKQFDELLEKFLNEYPLLRQEARRLLGELFDDDDYPDLNQVAAKFSFGVNILPLPKGDDFRCDIGTAEVDRIRKEITDTTNAAMQRAVADAFDRVTKVVEAYMDRLAGTETIFRDSLVQNARDLAEVLPALNVTGDPRLTEMATKLKEKLCAHEPDALRHNHTTRRETYEQAVAMHKDLMGFLGGGL